MSKIEIKLFNSATPEVLDHLVTLENQVFDKPFSREHLARECETKSNLLIQIAFCDGEPCGFKAGYELTSKLFYSWLGGVAPNFRGNGVAKLLMLEQHRILKDMEYKTVRTHTNNKFKPMLIFNLKFGFDVMGTMKGINEDELQIMLEKNL